jgi:site-specific recombinase XerD
MQQYMGHASLATTEIYMHFAPKHDAAQRLTEAFGVAEQPGVTAGLG